MKQKALTTEQIEVLKKLSGVISEARNNGIEFVYDTSDGSISAFNCSNVNCIYSGRNPESHTDEEMNWDLCEPLDIFDYCDMARQNLYLNFEEK